MAWCQAWQGHQQHAGIRRPFRKIKLAAAGTAGCSTALPFSLSTRSSAAPGPQWGWEGTRNSLTSVHLGFCCHCCYYYWSYYYILSQGKKASCLRPVPGCLESPGGGIWMVLALSTEHTQPASSDLCVQYFLYGKSCFGWKAGGSAGNRMYQSPAFRQLMSCRDQVQNNALCLVCTSCCCLESLPLFLDLVFEQFFSKADFVPLKDLSGDLFVVVVTT